MTTAVDPTTVYAQIWHRILEIAKRLHRPRLATQLWHMELDNQDWTIWVNGQETPKKLPSGEILPPSHLFARHLVGGAICLRMGHEPALGTNSRIIEELNKALHVELKRMISP